MAQPDVLADELAVRNVLARLAQLADTGDLDEYLTLFTDDASWHMPGQEPRVGHADIRSGAEQRRAVKLQGPGANSRHVLTTTAVWLDGDQATARSYWLFLTNTVEQPTLSLMGQYDDTLRRVGDGWRLARRVITMG
jgi:uncharacterized protein (TIGR02246 family)